MTPAEARELLGASPMRAPGGPLAATTRIGEAIAVLLADQERLQRIERRAQSVQRAGLSADRRHAARYILEGTQ